MNKMDLDLIKANSTIDSSNTSDYGLYYRNIHLAGWFTPICYHQHLSKSIGCVSISNKREKVECIRQSKVLRPIKRTTKHHYHTVQVKRKDKLILY